MCWVGGTENRMRNVLNPHLHSSSSLLFSSIGSYDRAIHKLPVVFANHAIHLRALVDLPEDKDGHAHKAGDEWQLKGPLTYIPQPEVVRGYNA